jgi:hypothetical protein
VAGTKQFRCITLQLAAGFFDRDVDATSRTLPPKKNLAPAVRAIGSDFHDILSS